jgi:hypothetical protein
MSINLIRMRNAAIAVKIEANVGVDAIADSPTSGDFIAGEIEVAYEQDQYPNTEVTGSLDRAPSINGRIGANVRIRMPLRGSGAPGTAPEWGKLMRACAMAETVTPTAIGAPTACTAGTSLSATLATPFAATAQLYRGMPLILTGTPADETFIVDYTAGRVATVGSLLDTPPSATTLAQIPINVRYSPTSDESLFKTVTLYSYADGLVWKFVGAMGSWSIELTSGGIGFLTFDMKAQPIAYGSTVALPAAALGISRQTPPRFINKKMQMGGETARLRSLVCNANVTVVLPDNPEAAQGVDAAVPTSRQVSGTLDPLMTTNNSSSRWSRFSNGSSNSLLAIIGAGAGNRFALGLPAVRTVRLNPSLRDELGVDAIGFEADGPDASVFLTAY